MGPDGHIAGLFKENIINKSTNNVGYVKRKDFVRIGLTLKCINNSKKIFLWAPKREKIKMGRKKQKVKIKTLITGFKPCVISDHLAG